MMSIGMDRQLVAAPTCVRRNARIGRKSFSKDVKIGNFDCKIMQIIFDRRNG